MKNSDNLIRQMIREALGLDARNGTRLAKLYARIYEAEEEQEPTPTAPEPEKSAADQAHALKLKYAGYGKWKDASGKTVAKTVKGKLVKMDGTEPTAAPKKKTKDSTAAKMGGVGDVPGAGKKDDLTPEKPDNPWDLTMKNMGVGKWKKINGGQPGSIRPPLKPDGNPYDITLDGKHGYVDIADIENSLLTITFDDGETVQIPLSKPRAPEGGSELDPELEKNVMKMFKSAGTWDYKPNHINGTHPGWNKNKKLHDDDIPYDANGEQTVQKLLAMIGDPAKLVRWLVKTFKKETPNGKKRILQYLGILKSMGVLDGKDAKAAENPAAAPQAPAVRQKNAPVDDLFAM